MSARRFIAVRFNEAGAVRLAPGVAKSGGREILSFPFRYSTTVPILGGAYPWVLSLSRCMEWWWRFRDFRVTMGRDDGNPDTSVTRSVTITRQTVLAGLVGASQSERDLFRPGIDRVDTVTLPAPCASEFTGSRNEPGWNGNPAATLEYGATVSLFGRAPSRAERLYMDGERFVPSVAITGFLNYSTPAFEVGISFTMDGGGESLEATVLQGYGGGTLSMLADGGTGGETFTFTVEPVRWYPCAGKWNESTGARNF
jgi:hypothetical protein